MEKESSMVAPLPASCSSLSSSSSLSMSETERIDVRASKITISLSRMFETVIGYHLYIVYADNEGQEFIFEGLPFDPKTGKVPLFSPSTLFLNPSGLLTRGQCIASQWKRESSFYVPSALSVTVIAGAKASEKYRCLQEQTCAFNSANIPYYMTTGPNSNSYVRTMLERCRIPAIKPISAIPAPGWDLSIELH
ncbi:hypothetical protein [Candidatus Nitrososphaera evergladensis]|uniref:hypothetical protein n=1 Tax=Candidatus Nitrososphaera evergladensis TaxID=1459637 RepID=UPI0011E59290|nr:hypothetical protein [Candidatus Nitrososphaera evergladensis]